jgi:stage II sporulation protein GA (sporulation sigma-E factor processing peptidase)
MVILYIDVLFAINFSMDFISLFLTNLILRKKVYKARMLISSLLGALYGALELLISTDIITGLIYNIIISALMCLIAFKYDSLVRFLASLTLFWGASASLGGIISVLYNFINKIFYEFISEYSYNQVYSGVRFFIVASLSILCALIINKLILKKREYMEVKIEIKYKDNKFNLIGLCDTGNLLKEPISGRNVILISKNSLLGNMIENEKEFKKRYIPYKTVNSQGIIKGIIPDSIKLNNKEVTAIIAPVENDMFSGEEALVPSSLL